MKKIVYNTCFGGFGLSNLALKEYAKLKGIELFFYKNDYLYSEDKKGVNRYTKQENITEDSRLDAFTKDYGDVFYDKYEEGTFYYPDIQRDDIDLIAIVEKLGEKANGSCANLQIAEVEGKWRIDEYDGNESVMEPSNYIWND